jgi:hypothetical protein
MKNQINYRLLVFPIAIFIGLLFSSCSNKKENKSEVFSAQGNMTNPDFTVCHKSSKPSGKMYATKISDLKAPSWDIQLTLICLQGLVNRESPSLFIVQDTLDEKWLKWNVERGDVKEVEWVSAEQIIDKFASVAKGIVMVDTLIPATFNTGTMLGGIKNYLVATPSVIEKYSLVNKISKHTGDDLLDLREFHWKKDVEAYQWFYDKYYDQLTHKMCAMTDPYDLPLRDYMVEFKVPLFWVKSDRSHEEMIFTQDLLMKLPPNIPCLGWPFADHSIDKGLGEHMGVTLVNEYAKYQVCSGWESVSRAVSNLSVHSGTSASLKNSNQPIPQLENKVYIAFIRTDGDGPNFYMDRFRRLWDDSTTHGKFAMGWQLGPTIFDLMPDVLDWYYKHATPNDYFVNALSGIGYIHEANYAYMYPPEKQKQIWKEYMQLSKLYRERINLSTLTTYHDMSDEKMGYFASIGFQGIFANYGRSFVTSLHNQVTEVNGVPVFSAIVDRVNSAESLAKDIRLWSPLNRPAFVFVSLSNWVTSLKPIDEALKELGPEYMAVNPEQLVGLYWKSKQINK